MKNTLLTLSVGTILAFGTGALAADATSSEKSNVDLNDNGGYEAKQHSESTSSGGTYRSSDSKTKVDVDSSGHVSKTEESESTVDPKGLMNKRKDSYKSVTKEKNHGGLSRKVTHKHTDRNGTNITEKSSTDVDVDKQGNVTENTKTKRTVDPKGLMNSTTSSSETKSVNGNVTEHTEETK